METKASRPLRVLVVLPSWVGDAVMATPALRLLRDSLTGSFIGALCRPGIDEVLGGTDLLDEFHVDRAAGVMGHKRAAGKLRPRRYDTALLLTNSFSTALIVRIAGIRRRVGYDRDARGLLLTDRISAPRRTDGSWAPIPAVAYYWHAACTLLDRPRTDPPPNATMELGATPEQARAADAILAEAGLGADSAYAILNPGANNPAKRWPAQRFAALADHLADAHGLRVLINGSPAEADLVSQIAGQCRANVHSLPDLGVTLGSLKALTARARLMVTNDTGPRHFAAALGVPLVSLFGPTDPRWTTIPTKPGVPEIRLSADPTLPEGELADDHPDRCRIDRIGLDRVIEAVDEALRAPSHRETP